MLISNPVIQYIDTTLLLAAYRCSPEFAVFTGGDNKFAHDICASGWTLDHEPGNASFMVKVNLQSKE